MEKINIAVLFVALALKIALTSVLVKRKLYQEFPFFFVYIVSSIVGSIVKLCVVHNYQLYFIVFWSKEALDAILILLALHEIFYWAFFPFFHIYRWFWALFPATVVLVASFGIWQTLKYPAIQASSLIRIILSLQIGDRKSV